MRTTRAIAVHQRPLAARRTFFEKIRGTQAHRKDTKHAHFPRQIASSRRAAFLCHLEWNSRDSPCILYLFDSTMANEVSKQHQPSFRRG
jgi:hypothetical protein